MDLPHKELTENIIGVCFDVYNELGWGFREQYYERAIIEEFKIRDISYNSQVTIPIKYKNKTIGYNRCDILVYNKIIIELKVGSKLIKKDFDQINEYLKKHNVDTGLLILFSPRGVIFKRIFNRPNYSSSF
jgi:GxxExxY protein